MAGDTEEGPGGRRAAEGWHAGCFGEGMHFTYFAVKRVHLRALHKVQKPMMARFGLTPARFDVLYMLSAVSRAGYLLQSRVWKRLDVSRATISRMMQALERLGFVTRKRADWGDRRQVEVSLTTMARKWMERVFRWLRLGRQGPVTRATHSIFVEKWWDENECTRSLENFEATMGHARRMLMDRANLDYPWHPER